MQPSSPIICLSPLPFSSLPVHPSLDSTHAGTSTDNPRPHLPDFLQSVLLEAETTIMREIFPNDKDNGDNDNNDPKTKAKKGKLATTIRSSPPSTAKVHLSTSTRRLRRPRQINNSSSSPDKKNRGRSKRTKGKAAKEEEKEEDGDEEEEEEEFWVCRQSVHEDAPQTGTACWDEFVSGLRRNHVYNEMAYTPSLTGVARLLDWPIQDEIEGGWRGVHMEVNLITHTFNPSILISPRTFLSLSISADFDPTTRTTAAAAAVATSGFLTIQIPVGLADTESSAPTPLFETISAHAPKSTIFAAYTSVERVLLFSPVSVSPAPPPPQSISTPGVAAPAANNPPIMGHSHIEWTMATASSAGGMIPKRVQRSWRLGGVPRAVVADVGLFIGWVARERERVRERERGVQKQES
ncbi:hypothetical protein Egran_06022 [Elaphomyces granulatus]|uniref:DUF3074 domain-containing protein n=1 Tax=Elaphomyces granulatus TaxID=519963 RepID=A0A232LPX2_9EURO|nr:hypothetical protein Egran_06022 [Elaphomyces granulatus]